MYHGRGAVMEETAQILTVEAAHEWGKLLFLGKDGQPAEHYTISKSTVVLGRDKNCDIVIPRREVSRQHARLAVDDSGGVWLSSMGKEPVCVNGQPAHDAVELYSGDQIEILLEGRTKVICFEAAQEDTIKINKNPSTGRIPLGEADMNTADCTLREGALAAAAMAQKTPRSAVRPPPVKRSAAPAPAPPPMPAKGSLFAGSAVGASAKAPPPRPPPVPGSRIPAAPHKPVEVPAQSAPGVAQNTVKPAQAPAPGTFLPSAVDLQALRAGLRKTNPGFVDGTAAGPPAATVEAAKASRDAKAAAKKRKSVRFNIPAEDPASPEGVAADATAYWGETAAQSPDVIINVSADNTAAFSAWAMGTRAPRCSLADLTGDGLGLPSIQEETGSEGCASPDEDVCMQQVTPSRQITPAIRRRSGVMSSAKRGPALPASPESVGRKRRSCSGSRNGTPAVRDRRSASVGIDVSAMLAEDSALNASLAAAEAAAQHAEKQDGDITLNLAAAAQKLEAMATEQPEEEEVAATPPPTADVAPGDMGTPWTKEIEHEASAFAKLLAAASRSLTPQSPQGTPQRVAPLSRAHTPVSGKKSRFSLPAGNAADATATQEAGGEPHAPANTPTSALDAQGGAGLALPGPSPMDMAEAAVQQMTSDQPASGNVADEEVDDVDVALDSALEAFPEEELVRRDHIVSLMTNFKTALARAKEAETRAQELEGLLGEAEKLVNTLQSENADLKCQLAAVEACSPAQDLIPSAAPSACEAGEKTVAATPSAAPPTQHPAAPAVAELAKGEAEAAAAVPVNPRSPDHLLALAAGPQRRALTRRCTSDAGLLPGGPAGQSISQTRTARRCSEGGTVRSAARLPLAARTCLLRAQDALLASSPAQLDNATVLAVAAAMTMPDGSPRDAISPAGQPAEPATAGKVEDPMLPPLPFEGLSQRLSQGTCEWMEGILMKTGSQDISPPKDIEEAALPAKEPKTTPILSDHSAGAAPEEAQPAAMTVAAAVPSEDAVVEPATEATGNTGVEAPQQEAVLDYPLDIGSPGALQPILDASQESVEEAELAAAVEGEEPDVAPENAPDQAGDAAPTEAAAEDDEEDEDRCCVCDEAEEGNVLLLCDSCDNAFHLQCTKPRLRKIPAGDWHCHECRAAKKAASKGPKPATSTEAVLSEPEAEPKTAAKPARRSTRSGSGLPETAAEEATVTKRATRRTSIAPAADEVAEAPVGGWRRQSVAPAQTPAAAAAPAGGPAPTTAVSMRGRRRRPSVSPIPDSITKEDNGRATRGARRVPAASAVTELSLGPPQGSLGVIMEEGSEEAGSEADEGQSAPQAESAMPSAAKSAPSKGQKRGRAAAKTEVDSPAKPAKRTRAGKAQAAPQTRRSTRASSRS